MKKASREFFLGPCDEFRCTINECTGGDRHDIEFVAPVVIGDILAGNFPSLARRVPLATVSARGTYGRESSIIAES
jgi:hypothetical protein